jgi:hypothetical protein
MNMKKRGETRAFLWPEFLLKRVFLQRQRKAKGRRAFAASRLSAGLDHRCLMSLSLSELPFSVSQLKAGNVIGLEWHVLMTANLTNYVAMDDGNVLNLPTIPESN